MRTSWTLGKKLFTAVGTLGALIALSSGLSWWSASALKGQLDVATQKTARKQELALRIESDARGLRSEQRRALLAGFANDPATVEQATQRIQELDREIVRRLDELTPLLVTEDGKRAVADIRRDQADWMKAHGEVDRLLDAGQMREAWTAARERANPIIDRIDRQTDDLMKTLERLTAQSTEEAESLFATERLLVSSVVFLSLIIVSVVVWVVRDVTAKLRVSTGELRSGADQVVAASSQVSSSSQSLSQGATEQAASLEETSASMEEMASMTRRNAENSHQAAGLMEEVDRRVSESN